MGGSSIKDVDFIENKYNPTVVDDGKASTVEVSDGRFNALNASLKEARKLSDKIKEKGIKRLKFYEVNGAEEKAQDIFEDENILEDDIGLVDSNDLNKSIDVVGNLKRHLIHWIKTSCSNFVKISHCRWL